LHNANDAKTFLKHFSDCLFYFCSACADCLSTEYDDDDDDDDDDDGYDAEVKLPTTPTALDVQCYT